MDDSNLLEKINRIGKRIFDNNSPYGHPKIEPPVKVSLVGSFDENLIETLLDDKAYGVGGG